MKIDTMIRFKNFRDIAAFNERIRPGLLYRSTALCLYQNEDDFLKKLEAFNIQTIIDLRADRELDEIPYKKEALEKANYIHAPFDPWNQPKWFKESYQYGTNEEIAYRFFVLACKPMMQKLIRSFLNHKKGIVVIHCHHGKDRTGIVFSLLHLLSGADRESIYRDYLASGQDSRTELLDIALDLINQEGGVTAYLKTCGLNISEIEFLKQKIVATND